MVSSILNMRFTLEETTRRSREVESENRLLLHKSETDALTGLANRFRLNEFSEEAFTRGFEKETYLAVELLDIDFFKQYNDNYGHQKGDGCICRIADALRSMEQHSNVFTARYGGDEFVVIYEGYTRDEVYEFAEELKNRIVDYDIEHAFSEAARMVTISQGICCDIPHEGQKVWDYLHTADMMLYRGKKISRNSIHIGYCGEE